MLGYVMQLGMRRLFEQALLAISKNILSLKTFKETLIKQQEEKAASIYDHETDQAPKLRGRQSSTIQ